MAEPESQERDDAALGHTVRVATKSLLATIATNPRTWLAIAGILGYGWMQNEAASTGKLLLKISDDVVQVKLQTSAIMQTLPAKQQQQAQRIVEIQLAALKMAKESQ